MATEVLDIVVRQRGARVVARDIAKIGIAAGEAARAVKTLQRSLTSAQGSLQRVQATTKTATTSMKGFGGAAIGAKRSLTALGTGVALVGGVISAALIRPLVAAIRVAGDFQAAMQLTGVLLNIDRTGEAFKELENRAKQLGITTVFSAVEAAEGMQFLARAGFEANEVLAAIGPTTNLAAAASINLGRAADISTNILRGFRLTVAEFPAAVDILASAFTRSNATIEDFANAFREAGPVAVDFNQRFGDVAAVLAALADAGIKTSKAGFALRRILVNLEKDAAKLAPVLNKAGISIREIGEDGVSRLRPLGDIFIDVANSSLSTADKITLFGVRALAASGIIANSAEGLEKFAKIIEQDFGRAADVGKARLLGFNGAMIEMESALKGLGIEIVQGGILDFLEGLVDKTTAFIRAVAGLPQPIKTAIGVVVGLAAVIAVLTLKIGLLIIAMAILKGAGGIAGVTEVLGKFNKALKATSLFFLTNPVGIAITALGLLAAALFLTRDETVKFGTATTTVGDAVATAWDKIVGAFQPAAALAAQAADTIKESLEGILKLDFGETIGESIVVGVTLVTAGAVKAVLIAAAFAKQLPSFLVNPLLRTFFSLGKSIPEVFRRAIRGDFAGALEVIGQAGVDGLLGPFKAVGAELEEINRFIDEGIENFFADSTKKTEKRAADLAKAAAEGARVIPGGPKGAAEIEPIGLSKGEIQARERAFEALFKSMSNLTEIEAKLGKASFVLQKAVKAEVVTAEGAALIHEILGQEVFAELERSIDPVVKSLRDEERALRDVTAAAKAGKIPPERLARVMGLVEKKFRDARLEMKEFQEQMGTGEAITEGLRKGFEDFNDSLGTLFSNTREVVSSTLTGMLEEVNKFVTTGEADFRGFALSVIAEIQKIIIKLLVLQGIRAFEATIEQGGTVGEFAKAFFGPRLEATQPGAVPAAPAGAPAPGITTAAGFQLQGPQFGAVAAAEKQLEITNAANNPVPTELLAESPGVVAINETLGLKLDESKTATVEQLTQLNSSISTMNERLAVQAAAGAGRTDPVTGALEGVSQVTGQGLVENKAEVAKQGGIVDKTTQQGFKDNIGTAITVGGNIVRALTSGKKADQAAAIGSIVGAIGFAAFGLPPQLGAQIGGQAGGIAGSLQAGGIINPANVGQPFLVGERGPEVFKPPTTGMVVPNDMLGMLGGAPEVNVQVVNVDDARAIPEAISTREGELAIMNVITRNKGRLREIIS
ncbi:MAG: phage tail tape measure protein [Gemmatimonadota bacterium]